MSRLFTLFILIFLLVIYRQAIFGSKIIFPSNYLASFYSPWSTQKFPGWEQGIPHKPIGSDQLRFFYPNRTFVNDAIQSGRIPLWNPYVFSGNPFLANFQSAVFYPLNALYLVLPQISAWSILIFIQPLLAGVFCFLFLSSLPIKRMAAVFGAFAFGFSGFVITWSQEAMALGHAAIWLPLILYGIEKRRFLTTVVALTLSILAGYLQMTFYISVFTLIYALFRHVEIKRIILVFLTALGLSAIQLVPSFEAFWLSARPTSSIETVFATYLLPVAHLVKLIAPDINGNPAAYNYFGKGSYNETALYIGVVPLVFAIFATVRKHKDRLVRFFLFSTLLTYLLTSDFFLTRWFLHLPFPLIPTFQPSRIFILTTFGFSVLSALGLSDWLEKRKADRKILIRISLGLGGFLLLMLGYLYFSVWQRDWLIAVKNSVLPLVMLAILLITLLVGRKHWLVLVVIIGLTVFGQYYFFNKYAVLGDKQFLYPTLPVIEHLQSSSSVFDRHLALGQPIYGDFATQLGIYSPEGYDPIFSKRYGQLIFASQDFMAGKLSEDIPRIEVVMSQTEKNPENYRRARLMSLLGVKTVVNATNQWEVLENKQALPRAFLASNVIVEPDSQKILDKIFDPTVDLRKTIILEENLPVNLKDGSGAAKIVSYKPESVEITTEADGQKLLFLSDNFYPGWKAMVDGQPTPIYRADFSFRSVVVPDGKHLVRFAYDPASFKIGVIISLVTGLLLLLRTFLLKFLARAKPE